MVQSIISGESHISNDDGTLVDLYFIIKLEGQQGQKTVNYLRQSWCTNRDSHRIRVSHSGLIEISGVEEHWAPPLRRNTRLLDTYNRGL